MKLQNKKTGRVLTKYTIRALEGVDADKGNERIVLIDDETHDKWTYYTLAQFNEEWEDYEEQAKPSEGSRRKIWVEQARDLGMPVKVDIYHSIIDFSKIRLPVIEIHRKIKDCGKTEAELIISLDQKTGVLTYRVLNKELGYDFVYTPHEFNFVAWTIIGEDK